MSAADLFKDQYKIDTEGLFTTYHVKLQVRGVLVGGVPSNPSVIRSWLTARMELGDAALEELLDQTISERSGPMTVEDKVDAIAKSSVAPSVNGFKRNADGILCWEGRCAKAALKEAANSAYPGTEWDGKASSPNISKRKGLMSTMVERIFVPDLLIPLGVHDSERRQDADPTPGGYRVEERIKHVITPMGPRSAINLVEVIERPVIEFDVRVHDDFLSPEAWLRIWVRSEDIGIGADRGRSDGQYEMLAWSKVEG